MLYVKYTNSLVCMPSESFYTIQTTQMNTHKCMYSLKEKHVIISICFGSQYIVGIFPCFHINRYSQYSIWNTITRYFNG